MAMNYVKHNDTYVVRLEKGEEVITALKSLCVKEDIKAASLTGIGAANYVEAGFFDAIEKRYYPKKYEEDLEILALNGNITSLNNEPYIHLHITIADSQGRALGGHLNKAVISVTCEIFIQKLDAVIERYKDEEFGICFIK